MKQKKCAASFVLLLLSVSIILPCRTDASVTLGSPEGWQCGELRSSEFAAVSGSQGFWLERSYRTSGGIPIEAVLMTGKGPGALYVPPAGVDAAEGPLGSGGEYKTLTVGGHPALLERYPFRGVVLAVKTEAGTLTLESPSAGLSDWDIVSAAGVLLVSGITDI